MKRSESIGEIAKALSKCQSELKDVFKGTEGYGYNYAPLNIVYDEVRPKMTQQGLSLTHEKSFNKELDLVEVRSMLMHDSGEWIEYYGALPFKKGKNSYQDAGSGFTYLERYQTSAIFAITADEDNDGGDSTPPTTPPTTPKKTSADIIATDKADTLEQFEAWVVDVTPQVRADLTGVDLDKFKKYLGERRDAFSPKKPQFLICPNNNNEMPVADCAVADCRETCKNYQDAVR